MDSTAWGWGGSFLGLLGHGSGTGSVTAVRSLNLTEVVQVSAGGSFTMYLKKDGTVWMTGDGRFGAMGNGTNTAENNTPVQVSNLTNVVAIAAGNNNPYALRSDGTVWGWAINNQGQMGDGIPSQPDRLTPIQIPNLTNAIKIAAGANHALAIREDSTVWGWGRNDFSQAGAGAGHRPAAVITGLSGIKEIGCGEHFSMALKGDGTVWVWGRNHQGQLGLGDYKNRNTYTKLDLHFDIFNKKPVEHILELNLDEIII
jgi:alpha-tubulin suppressor-like RCC1 family protein